MQTPREPSQEEPSEQPTAPSEEKTLMEMIMAAGDAALESLREDKRQTAEIAARLRRAQGRAESGRSDGNRELDADS
jgi:hypothetical protein